MDMKNHFQKMFAYNEWANSLFIQLLKTETVTNTKVYLLFSHILNAEEVWLARIQNNSIPNQNIWKERSFLQLQEKALQQKEAWEYFLNNLKQDDFAEKVSYHNSKGQHFLTDLGDILTHVINHGTYHRAQVANLLRQEEIDPPVSDFIAYVRQP